MALDIQDYLRIARERWLVIVLSLLVAIGIGTALTLGSTAKYQSTARLFVSTPASDAQDAFQGSQFSGQRVKSYAELLSGEEVSRRVIAKLKIKMDPRELADQISGQARPDTVVLSISVTDRSATRARELTQATAEVFVDYVAELETPAGKSTAPIKASIVDQASEPGGPISPKPVRNIALAVILGLILGIGLAVMRDLLDRRIRSMGGLRRVIGDLPVVGTTYYDRQAVKKPLILGLSSHSPRVESYRVLRTNLQFLKAGSLSKVFVFTSALPGEGKSTTVCNLVLSIAETGQRVLLIEGDLRRPKASEYLNLENSVGVTTVLIGALSVDEAIQPLSGTASVLARGATPPNPAELLQSDAMSDMLDDLRQKYDVIIIDAPPLLPVTDAAVLAGLSDGAILVVHHGKTTREQLETSLERLESAKAKALGVIVNMTPPPRRRGRGYGYGYGYGYAPTESAKNDTITLEGSDGKDKDENASTVSEGRRRRSAG